jgi:hypothetical protein
MIVTPCRSRDELNLTTKTCQYASFADTPNAAPGKFRISNGIAIDRDISRLLALRSGFAGGIAGVPARFLLGLQGELALGALGLVALGL